MNHPCTVRAPSAGRQQLVALQRSAAESELQLQQRCEVLQERVRRTAEAEERLGAEVRVLQVRVQNWIRERWTQQDDNNCMCRSG